MITKKILPFIFPINDAFSGCANRHGIMEAYDNSKEFVLMNDIALTTNQLDYNFGSFIEANSYIPMNFFVEKTITKKKWVNGLEQYLIDEINNNRYIEIEIDHYYIPKTSRYNKKHFYHGNAMIIGYDLNKQVFYVNDNFVSGKYSTLEVKISDIINARQHHQHNKLLQICSLCFNENIVLQYDINIIINILEGMLKNTNYIESDYLIEFKNGKRIYGLIIYDFLINYIEQAIVKCEDIDYRGFYVISIHMKAMLALIEHCISIYKNNIFHKCLNKYESLLNKSVIIVNLILKYNITKNQKLIDKINLLVRQICTEEKNTIEELLICLKSQL